jgi:cytochrome c-type biogenesis protein CcmH
MESDKTTYGRARNIRRAFRHWVCFRFGLAVLVLLSLSAATAAQPAPADDELEARARALEAKLMAPCCFTQTIDQHESEASQQIRAELRLGLAKGLSDEQVIDHYVARYGPRILAVPPQTGFNRLLYWMPHLVTVTLLIGVCLTLWVWYQRGHSGDAKP